MSSSPSAARRLSTRFLPAIALAGALVLGTQTAPAIAAAPAPDGSSTARAAASCWEVKQNAPDAPSGIYWLYTPALTAPQQFYCDQTTDGGGWVLIGRGREDWSQSGEGYGTPAQVRNTVDGTSAFAARELSARTIGALLNDAPVSSLPDGVRLRRASAADGSAWQEVRFTFSSPRNDWSWLFADLQRVGTWSFDGTTGAGGTTKSFGSDQAFRRVQTTVNKSVGYQNGFGFGNTVAGSTAATSYIWKGATGYARPFTQVYLRPKLMSSAIETAFPTGGTAARTQPSVASSLALPTVYGVNGLGAAGTGIQDTEVSAFTESKGAVYVGGNFAQVQRDSSGTGRVAQSYLAAFDVRTGSYIPGFTPKFNNQVKAVATLPDGRIVAGGDFSSVNGVAENGLVVLDPTTGAIDQAFTGRLINALSTSGGQATVRALDVQGKWLYVGGSFTHAVGGSSTAQVYSRGAVRLSVTDGTPDRSWTTEFDGTVISLDASPKGDRVYFAGYFANDKGTPTLRAAALDTTSGAVIPWTVDFTSASASYQQAVQEVGDRVWIGGSEHMVFSYHRSDMSEASTNLTSSEGGDGQAFGSDGTNVYAGCHCYLANYSDAKTHNWTDPGTAWTQASKIEATGAWNATTGTYVPAFSPSFNEREGAGTWAIFTDSTGVTWMGGDFTAVRTGSTGKVWAGGYARFAPNDSTAPTAPTGLTVVPSSTGVTVSWKGSTDASGAVTYQVMRDDRVVATTTSTSIDLPSVDGDPNYFVRAADASLNLSASTPAVKTTITPPPSSAGTLVADGSSWSWATSADAGWAAAAYDASGWASGSAPLGWGDSSIATTVSTAASKPLTTYYRKQITINAPDTLGAVTLSTRADDGVVVYVNGVEVGRSNMPSGAIGSGTYASSAVSTKSATAAPVTFTVPSSRFVQGENVIAAEVHANYRTTPNSSFDLSAVAGGSSPTPGQPLASGTTVLADQSAWSYWHDSTAVAAGWSASAFDDTGWPTARAALGWGTGAIASQLPAPASGRPLTTYFRSAFVIPDGGLPSTGLTLTTRADDGVAVFVNGVEVGRANLPTGTLTAGTYALSAPSTSTATSNPVTFTVPASLLRPGRNVIAAEMHSNYRTTPSASFDLAAVVR
ncbi:fibrinogen-like YCDxxxxGGGW domain-containing protein [Amnibacterium setariae]|uniref:Fibrinogen C-terminal domain-containing protein n=1 Tax=Amnibacterium setariae TaxID=2306585 RepID=A0A3A1U1Z8_9MICO|nr:fibrinogen-like YCDxxxxGGGW domain-containing protein [Amnibacterium setariae]RIX26627.1 hypothetical protein D1781_17085 [Amnibacterium setariae]